MTIFTPEIIKVDRLEQISAATDFRKDLHNFVMYFVDREVKRSSRTNQLSRTDVGRLAKILNKPEMVTEFERHGSSGWLVFLDYIAMCMNFISYENDGNYPASGYMSRTYPNNYVAFLREKYDAFLDLSALEQEQTLLTRLIEKSPYELFVPPVSGRLHSFYNSWYRINDLTNVHLAESRQKILQLLSQCQSGVWYSTASLIRYLSQTEPDFLIPRRLLPSKKSRLIRPGTRYDDYREGQSFGREPIPDNAPDGFERVQGRFVERFLEGIPLLLGYVDVAYRPEPSPVRPEMDYLVAFRVHEHFLQFMRGEVTPPKVIIQPNFEIHLESHFYPQKAIVQLLLLSQLQKEDRVIIFKLDKKLVAEAVARNPQLDVGQLLREMSGRDLPQNVQIELNEWAGHAEVFTLFKGFGLLENVDPPPAEINNYLEDSLTPHLHLVKQPQKLVAAISQAEQVVLTVSHRPDDFTLLPEKAHTVFPRSRPESKRSAKELLAIRREAWVTLYLANETAYNELNQYLVENRTLFESDKAKRLIRYKAQFQSQVDEALKKLKEKYLIQIEEI